MNAIELGPVAPGDRTQSAFDLFLIFAGANIVATTFQVGASLATGFDTASALALIAAGSVAGSALVASLAPLGPRLGVPSVVAARGALGMRGAGLVALLLYATNFVWIALNNVIAASVCSRILGGESSERLWAVGLGLLATVIVAKGPRAVSLADRLAVPLMAAVGVMLTIACLNAMGPADNIARGGPAPSASPSIGGWLGGFDIVIGYQVSWILMFADYSRFTRSSKAGATAVFLGLALTSIWFMPLGLIAARLASSADPGDMLAATGLGWWSGVLLALATITTNFVNIYLSSLAWKSLVPRTGDQASVWSIGLISAALSLFSSGWLVRFADFTLVLGSLLVPVGGVLLAHYFILRRPTRVADLYDERGPYMRHAGWSLPGLAGWLAGTVVYHLAAPIGSTLPALATAVAVYIVADILLRERL